MSLVGFVVLIVIAGVCGAIGQSLAGETRGGLLTTIVLGFIGAFLGATLAGELGLPEPLTVDIDGEDFPILWSVIGSALFVALLSLLTKKKK